MKIALSTFLLFFIGISVAFAQPDLDKLTDKADKHYKNLKYRKAIPLYEEAVALKTKHTVALRTKLAYCYRMINQMDKAEELYAELVKEENVKSMVFYFYGETLMASGRYDEAKSWFLKYDEQNPGDERGITMAAACDKAKTIRPVFPDIIVQLMPFSTEGDDYAPMFYGDGLLFVSDGFGEEGLEYDWTGRNFSRIYFAEKDSAFSFSDDASPFSRKFNKRERNSGPASLSGNGKYFYFSRNSDITDKDGDTYKMAIFVTEADGFGGWKKPKRLPFCNPNFNYMHPAASFTGDTLYFVSDKPLGIGETDIYMVSRKRTKREKDKNKEEEEKWLVPVNLGVGVNTAEREGFPYLHNDGTLYFASKGWAGFGGFDLFLTRLNRDGVYENSSNLGSNINSPKDDIGLVLSPNKQSGYFASNRRNGTDDDIFAFVKGSVRVTLLGDILEKKTQKPLTNAKIVLSSYDEDLVVFSSSDGKFEFKARPDRIYKIQATLRGHSSYEYILDTKGMNVKSVFPLRITLQQLEATPYANIEYRPSIESEEEVFVEKIAAEPAVEMAPEENNPYQYLPPSIPSRSLFARQVNKVVEKNYTAHQNYKEQLQDTTRKTERPTAVGAFEELPEAAQASNEVAFELNIINNELMNISGVRVVITNQTYNKTYTLLSDSNGKLETNLAHNATYIIELKHEGYQPKITMISTGLLALDGSKVFQKTMVLQKIGRTDDLQKVHIYYATGEFMIKEEGKKQLNQLIQKLLTNPEFIVEIASHLDSAEDGQFSEELSNHRNLAVAGYLIAGGVAPNRIKSVVHRAEKPAVPCNNAPCGEAEHQKNRRTEIQLSFEKN